MDGLISTFHISWKLLIAQAVNFAIVFVVLYRFAFKPLARTLSERKREIEQGIEEAEKSRELLKNAEYRAEEILSDARGRANEIIREAKQKHDEMLARIQKEAEQERQRILNKAREEAEQERQRIEKGIFSRLADFIPALIAKVLREEKDEAIRLRYMEHIEKLIQQEKL